MNASGRRTTLIVLILLVVVSAGLFVGLFALDTIVTRANTVSANSTAPGTLDRVANKLRANRPVLSSGEMNVASRDIWTQGNIAAQQILDAGSRVVPQQGWRDFRRNVINMKDGAGRGWDSFRAWLNSI